MKKFYDVLAVGISAVDDLLYVSRYPQANCKVPVIESARHGGGPACTAIATVGSLTGKAAYVARFGDNTLSGYVASSLRSHGVDISHMVCDPAGGPYHSIIIVDSSGNRNVFYDASLFRIVGAEDLADSLIQSASVVLLDHITEPALAGVAAKVRGLGVPMVGDVEGCSESAMSLAALIDYLIVPAEFAAWASGTPDPVGACSFLAQTGRVATVVTSGAEGCYFSVHDGSEVQHLPAFEVNAFDTNGCGDAFHGAFAFAVARCVEVREALVFASATAALKATGVDGTSRGWDAIPSLEAVFSFLRSRVPGSEGELLLKALEVLSEER